MPSLLEKTSRQRPSATPTTVVLTAEEITARERARQLLNTEIAFIDHESFRTLSDHDFAQERSSISALLNAIPDVKKLAGLPSHYQRMCETPLLTAEMESQCFRAMNWLKYRANVLRSTLSLDENPVGQIASIEAMLQESDEIRNFIVRANCRLAMSIVKTFSDARQAFDELLSESILTLVGAVEKFDFSRGFRFSTYATQSIRRRLYRILGQRQKQRTRFVCGSDEALQSAPAPTEVNLPFSGWKQSEAMLQTMMSQLEQRERLIMEARFGLHNSGQKQTFSQIGVRLRISKERVRQLAERALQKLQRFAIDRELDFPCQA